MTTTKSYDFLNRLTSIASVDSSLSPLTSYFYQYNDANQRTRVNLADGSFWIYEYDKLGQVISGKRYWSDWTPVAGQQYEYAFDDIGNRTTTKAGGDANGADLRTSLYSANALNQYTSHYVPPYLNVLGIAHANASVTVNSQSPYRRGEYFWKELSVDNSSAAIWQSITNLASLTGTNQTNTGNLFLPKTSGSFTYDADGNVTSDGRWTNRWDAENRLILMEALSSVPDGAKKKLVFGYDSQSRRVSKTLSNWVSGAWQFATNNVYVYDGWNLVGLLNSSGALVQSFLWGLDLSGSLEGAGGVGGLLAVTDSVTGTHFVAFDGSGNVKLLVDGKTGTSSAVYEYSPFGELIRCSGTAAKLNPFRFSTKFHDDESEFSYYGYRYLNANTGRWLSRDPIGERADISLYAFVRNSAVSYFDKLGKFSISAHAAPGYQNGPIAGECGNFQWAIVWQIDPLSHSEKGGIIVQYVAATFEVVDCHGDPLDIKEVTNGTVDPAGWPVYESWRIPKGRDITGSIPDDRWNMPSVSTCSRGRIVLEGAVTYYDAQEQHPPGYTPTGQPPTHTLPASRNPPPPEWGEGDGYLNRRLEAIWNCCSGDGKTKVTVQ